MSNPSKDEKGLYKDKKGRWVVDYRRSRIGESRFRSTRTFSTKTEANAYLKQLKAAVKEAADQESVMPTKMTLSEALDAWWIEKEDSITESNRNATRVRKEAWKKTVLAKLPLRDIKPGKLKKWVEDRQAEGAAGSTIRNDLHVVSQVYRWLEDEHNWLITCPVKNLRKAIANSAGRDRRLTPEEHEALSSAFKALSAAYLEREAKKEGRGHTVDVRLENGALLRVKPTVKLLYIGAAFQAAIECAMRQGKLMALTWADIDFRARVIKVKDTGPKNKGVPATVPISPTLIRILGELHGPVPRIGSALKEPVFGPLNGEGAYRYLVKVAAALGIVDLHWHDLRHEACSRLAEMGWTVLEIQRVSGHKTLQSLQRYVHVSVEAIHKKWDEMEAQQKVAQRTGT